MSKITYLKAREIIDSRGNPTVEVELKLDDLYFGIAQVPSGASTGSREAVELRDGDKERYIGKGVLNAVNNVNNVVAGLLVGTEIRDQELLDEMLIHEDGTPNKNNFGANAILGVSLAYAKAKSQKEKLKLYEYFADLYKGQTACVLPVPFMNILNGGQHADSNVDIQEFMIAPNGLENFREAMRAGIEVYHSLKKILKDKGLATSVGDEGGFAPNLKSNEEALKLVTEAIEKAGYKPGKDISICLDVAASELYKDGKYEFEGEGITMTSDELIEYYKKLIAKYPIISIEDGLAEGDWESWVKLNLAIGDSIKTVGDDLYATNTAILKRGIEEKSSNAILIKLNQIGTVTETIRACRLAKKHHFDFIISHRSGETEDTTIADLAVGLASGYIKTGAPCRTDRVCKYNQLLRIEEDLGDKARYGV